MSTNQGDLTAMLLAQLQNMKSAIETNNETHTKMILAIFAEVKRNCDMIEGVTEQMKRLNDMSRKIAATLNALAEAYRSGRHLSDDELAKLPSIN